jgi:hypothetical protein
LTWLESVLVFFFFTQQRKKYPVSYSWRAVELAMLFIYVQTPQGWYLFHTGYRQKWCAQPSELAATVNPPACVCSQRRTSPVWVMFGGSVFGIVLV